MFLEELLQQCGEVAVVFEGRDRGQFIEYPEGTVVGLVHLGDVWVRDHDVRERFEVQQSPGQTTRQL